VAGVLVLEGQVGETSNDVGVGKAQDADNSCAIKDLLEESLDHDGPLFRGRACYRGRGREPRSHRIIRLVDLDGTVWFAALSINGTFYIER
jgi:hypothetical protein